MDNKKGLSKEENMKGSRGTKGQMKKEAMNLSGENKQEVENSFDELTEKIFRKGMLPKDAMGINSNMLEGIYAQAYRLYNTGKYIEAAHLFRMLILLSSTESKYVLGLAACLHMLKEYKNAIQTYTMCTVLDPQNPIPYYHSSDCFIQMKDYLSAMVCLELAVQKSANKPEYSKLKERALLSLESIKKQQNE
jgi:type III secretion system low calcium response chaperone LcrH/SycD